MNALKIVKRDARTFSQVPEVSSARRKGQRKTEKIIKSWVRESRARRHALLTQLREAIGSE